MKWKFFEYDKRVKEDLQSLKSQLVRLNTKEKEDIKGLRKELQGYLKEILQQKENNFQRGEGWHQPCARNVKDLQELHEPNRGEVDSYLAFDENSVELEKQLTKLGLCLHDIP